MDSTDHTQQENFIDYREAMIAFRGKVDAIAEHFGIRVEAIRFLQVHEDPCHLGLFVERLIVRRDG